MSEYYVHPLNDADRRRVPVPVLLRRLLLLRLVPRRVLEQRVHGRQLDVRADRPRLFLRAGDLAPPREPELLVRAPRPVPRRLAAARVEVVRVAALLVAQLLPVLRPWRQKLWAWLPTPPS